MTFGFTICTLGSIGFAVQQYYVYQTSPCGYNATTCGDIVGVDEDPTSSLSYAWYAVPIIVTAVGEIFVNVTCYGLAYSRSPKNMKGFVSSINLFMTAISAAIGLATAPAIADPYLVWAFAGPTIVGAVSTVAFYFLFKHIDQEEFVLNTDFVDMKRDSDSENEIAVVEETTKKSG
jgi:dipeptide/tripeptide permease